MAILTPELLEKLKYGYYFWPILVVCSSVVALFNYVIELFYTVSHLKWIDGPSGAPVLGNAVHFFGKSCQDSFKLLNSWIDKYDGLAKIWIFHRPTLLISRTPLVQKLLEGTGDTLLSRGEHYKYLDNITGSAILTLRAKDWLQRRKVCNPYFESNLRTFIPKISHHAKALVDHFKDNAKQNSIIDIQQYAKFTSMDLTTDVLLDYQKDYLNCKDTSYINASNTVTDILMKRMLTPLYNWSLIYLFTFTRLLQSKSASVINSLTKKVISKRRHAREHNPHNISGSGAESLVQYLLDKQEESSSTMGDVNDKNVIIHNISDVFVHREINHFTFSSVDNLATGIAFSLYTLGLHSDIQEKLFEEVKSVMKDKLSSESCPSLEELEKLHLMNKCLKESLRLFPPVPWIFRQLRNTIKLDNGKYLPEGVNLAVSIYKIHRDEKNYVNPDQFDPERFDNDSFDDDLNYTYAPFGIGWRNCIGRKLAIIEMKLILLYLISNYKITSVTTPNELELTGNYVLRSSQGLNIKLTPRLQEN